MTLGDKLKLSIENGNIRGAKKLATIKFQNEDKAQWNSDRQAEYSAIYPTHRDMTVDEKADNDIDEDGTNIEREIDYVYPKVQIDYSEDETYVTYDEWINETILISEAVEEVTETSEDGIVEITTPYQPEVTEMVRPYIAPDVTDRVQSYPTIVAKVAELEKAKKITELDGLVVEHNTVAYDAHGAAIGNMASVVAVAGFKYNQAVASGASTVEAYQAIYKDTLIGWKTVDNSISMVQIESVAEALEKSMTRLAEIIGAK